MKKGVQRIIDQINDGELDDVLELFDNKSDVLIKFLEKNNVLDLIDVFSDDLEDEQNKLLLSLLNSDNKEIRDKYYEKIISLLSDVEKSGDDYYYIPRDIEDLADFFETYSRETSPYDVAKAVLSEDYWEPFWDTTDNVYIDVIEVLNLENRQFLKDRILKLLERKKIELDGTSSEEMELIAAEQGHEDYIEVTSENIDRIIGDEDTMDFLLNSELGDVKNDLENIHQGAYNDAYNNEYYKKVWNELGEYFDGKPEWVQSGKKYVPKLKVTSNIHRIIDDFLSAFEKYGYQDTIGYHGSLLGLIQEITNYGNYDKLSFRIYDYPDSREVDRNINLNFKDYF